MQFRQLLKGDLQKILSVKVSKFQGEIGEEAPFNKISIL